MLPNFDHPTIVLWYAIFVACVGVAIVRGGAPERAAALFLTLMLAFRLTAHGIAPPQYSEVDEIGLVTDGIALAGLLGVALTANRLWPMAAAALQVLASGAHFGRLLPEILGYVYSVINVFPTLICALIVAIGAIRHHLRQKKYGTYRSWRVFAPLDLAYHVRDEAPFAVQARIAMSRGYLEYPILACSALILIFCAAWYLRLAGSDGPAEIGLPWLFCLTAAGFAILAFGLWYQRREQAQFDKRVADYLEQYGDPADQIAR